MLNPCLYSLTFLVACQDGYEPMRDSRDSLPLSEIPFQVCKLAATTRFCIFVDIYGTQAMLQINLITTPELG